MILCCGEALIDMLPRKTASGEAAFAPHAGGAVFNTAIALGRLEAPAGFFSGISNDLFGRQLETALADSDVDFSLVHRSDRPTTLAFVELVEGQARYHFYDENTAGRMLGDAELPTLGDEIDAMFFGGISLASEPCGSAYETLMTRGAGSRVTMIDPNVRPRFIRDAATYRSRIGRMIALADIVKISDEDLHWLEGPGDPAVLAAEILARGPKVVCITAGPKGATAYASSATVAVESRRVTVVDTVGAGDTFNAGFLAGLYRAGKLDRDALAAIDAAALRDALELGARAAAVTVARAGANPPRSSEL